MLLMSRSIERAQTRLANALLLFHRSITLPCASAMLTRD